MTTPTWFPTWLSKDDLDQWLSQYDYIDGKFECIHCFTDNTTEESCQCYLS